MAAPRRVEAQPSTPPARHQIIQELDTLETMMAELRLQYELYFTALIPRAPEKLHTQVKRKIATTRKLPFKNTEHLFRLRSLDHRFQTLNSYWMRVLREKEAGTYSKDVYRAELHDALEKEEQFRQTQEGKREAQMQHLFSTYEKAFKEASGAVRKLDFGTFKKELVLKAQTLKEKFPDKKVKFAVVVKNGSVQIQAKAV